MQRTRKRYWSVLTITLCMCAVFVALPGLGGAAPPDDIVILFTNDVHGAFNADVKYAGVAGTKQALEMTYNDVYLVDAGDAIQGSPHVSLTKGKAAIDIMNQVGYDAMALGNHEFDFGIARLFELRDLANFPMLSANFVKISDGSSPGFASYKVFTAASGKKVAIVGVTTPEAMTKASPVSFQDASGNYIYNFSNTNLAAKVQAVVNEVRTTQGADYVILLGHLGVDEQSSPWRSTDIIAGVNGVDAFIDGHSHSTIVSQNVGDKSGNNVVHTQAGTKLSRLGKLTIDDATGAITAEHITAAGATQSAAVQSAVDSITAELAPQLDAQVATTAVKLTTNFEDGDTRPYALATGTRAVRRCGTNMGDLCADAFLSLFKRSYGGADVAIMNGGGVRESINVGNIQLKHIIAVQPFNNTACLIEVTGQQLLDAMEFGTMMAPGAESGGFPQIAGMTFEVHSYLPSTVTLNTANAFVSVDGEYRVKNVKIGGKPLDLNKKYKVAGQNFMLKDGGDGYSMFKGAPVILDQVMVDNDVLSSYIIDVLGGAIGTDSKYADPAGQNRIKFAMEQPLECGCFCSACLQNGSCFEESTVEDAGVTVLCEPDCDCECCAVYAPTIDGPSAVKLTEGYKALSSPAFTFTGTGTIALDLDTDHGGKIVFNGETLKFDIAAGLKPGVYPVVMTASNGVEPDATFTFTVTVAKEGVPPTGDLIVFGNAWYALVASTTMILAACITIKREN